MTIIIGEEEEWGANFVVVRKSRLCKKPLNKSLHQSKSSARGVETRRASVDRDSFQSDPLATTVSVPNTTSPIRILSLFASSPLPSQCGQWEALEYPSPHGNPSVKKQRP